MPTNAAARDYAALNAIHSVQAGPMLLAAAQDREALARLQRQLFAARTEVARFGV